MNDDELTDVLNDVVEFLDNYVDVNDGADDGPPVPNEAMRLQARVRELLNRRES